MNKLIYESARGAFEKIGAVKEDGSPYRSVRGISVSAVGRHFRFWSTDTAVFEDTVEISRPGSRPPPAWLSQGQGRKFFRALEEAKRNQWPIFGTINVKSDAPDQDGNSIARSAAALMDSEGKPAKGTVLEADPSTGRLLIRFSDIELGNAGRQNTESVPTEDAEWLTTDELAGVLAGGDAYIRTKGGEVKGLALTQVKNPQAPSIVIVGNGPRIKASAELFMGSGRAVPVYLKERTNRWRLEGRFRAVAYRTDASTISQHCAGRAPETIAGILFLEREQIDDEGASVAGRAYVDPALRVMVEKAAVEAVKKRYREHNFTVESVESKNLGFDLLATKGEEVVHIEVKGTSGPMPRFFISRNERRRSRTDPNWRLIVVTDALSAEHVFHEMNATEAERLFNFDALSWECTLHRQGL